MSQPRRPGPFLRRGGPDRNIVDRLHLPHGDRGVDVDARPYELAGRRTNFAAELLTKDLRYAVQAAEAAGRKVVSVVSNALRRYSEIVAERRAGEDFTIVGV